MVISKKLENTEDTIDSLQSYSSVDEQLEGEGPLTPTDKMEDIEDDDDDLSALNSILQAGSPGSLSEEEEYLPTEQDSASPLSSVPDDFPLSRSTSPEIPNLIATDELSQEEMLEEEEEQVETKVNSRKRKVSSEEDKISGQMGLDSNKLKKPNGLETIDHDMDYGSTKRLRSTEETTATKDSPHQHDSPEHPEESTQSYKNKRGRLSRLDVPEITRARRRLSRQEEKEPPKESTEDEEDEGEKEKEKEEPESTEENERSESKEPQNDKDKKSDSVFNEDESEQKDTDLDDVLSEAKTDEAIHADASVTMDEAEENEETKGEEIEAANNNDHDYQQRHKDALDALTHIEVEFARLRDRMYQEKMSELNEEAIMIANGTHPELASLMAEIEEKKGRRIHSAEAWRKHQYANFKQQFEGFEYQANIHFISQKNALRRKVLERLNTKKWDIEDERSKLNDFTRDHRISPDGRELVAHKKEQKEETVELQDIKETIGFPMAPNPSGLALQDVDDDLRLLGLPTNNTNNKYHL